MCGLIQRNIPIPGYRIPEYSIALDTLPEQSVPL